MLLCIGGTIPTTVGPCLSGLHLSGYLVNPVNGAGTGAGVVHVTNNWREVVADN